MENTKKLCHTCRFGAMVPAEVFEIDLDIVHCKYFNGNNWAVTECPHYYARATDAEGSL